MQTELRNRLVAAHVYTGDAGPGLQFFHKFFGAAVLVGFTRDQVGQAKLAGPSAIFGRTSGVLVSGRAVVVTAAIAMVMAVAAMRVIVAAGGMLVTVAAM